MSRTIRHGWPVAAVLALAACGDTSPTATTQAAVLDGPATKIQALDCVATVATGTVSCGAPASSSGARRVIIGGQNDYVRLTSSNISSTPELGLFQMEVTVQNLLHEAIGTFNGEAQDPAGIRVFFFEGPTTTGGTGSVVVLNADGTDLFLGSTQPYFRYDQKLAKDEVSAAKIWHNGYDEGVTSFSFKVYVAAEVQPLLVINEVMVNPANFNAAPDVTGEWIEVYNAGRLAVQMQGMAVSDSAPAGRRPYHVIASSLMVQPGAYVVLGKSTNTTDNGGVPVDYSYGGALLLGNSLDAIKLSRLLSPGDTTSAAFTVDRTQYASAAVSAKDGISRELTNPALDNANMDGSNWAEASVTSVYGSGGRGTPRAQNSTYTP